MRKISIGHCKFNNITYFNNFYQINLKKNLL